MGTLSPQAQSLLMHFGQQPGVTADQLANLQKVILSSPPLVDQVNGAVAAGHLLKFELLPPGISAGGTYNPGSKSIALPASILTTSANQSFNMGEPVFVLGHELQHGFNG